MLKDVERELLDVYRALVGSQARERRLERDLEQAERDKKHAERCCEDAEKDAKRARENYREIDEENLQLILNIIDHRIAADICLDLIGAVLEEEAFHDRMHESIMTKLRTGVDPFFMTGEHGEIRPAPRLVETPQEAQDRIVAMGGTRIMPVDPRSGNGPLWCLSCNQEKGGMFYLCEPCFDADVDNGGELFGVLKDLWDGGARDFPRDGLRAKDL
jgi:hypothetical protein